jgi:SAM-dependent methyltransferase
MGEAAAFDSYLATLRELRDEAAPAWRRWAPAVERWLRPATEAMLDGAGISPGQRVLDFGAGVGQPALEIARRVGPTGRVLAWDLSPRMAAFATAAVRRAGLGAIVEVRAVRGGDLHLAPRSLDAAVSRLGFVHLPALGDLLAQLWRALAPRGRLATVVYGAAAVNPAGRVPGDIMMRRVPLPAGAPREPRSWDLAAPGALASALSQAGFRGVGVQAIPASLRFDSSREFVRFERQCFPRYDRLLKGRPAAERRAAWAEVRRELLRFDGPAGFAGPGELLLGTATA